MKLAFYAPLKPPDHPVPSGDRLIANLLIRALEKSGLGPTLAARFRSYDGRGDATRQRRLKSVGERLAQRLIVRLRRLERDQQPRLWITYHLYHKAPDWLGPPVSRALGIPYVVIEGTVAPKQSTGPWREGFLAATEAIVDADLVVAINSSDMPCVRATLKDPGRLVQLRPFIDLSPFDAVLAKARRRATFAAELGIPADATWLVTVAMMRPGNKLDSYRLLASALGGLQETPWHLLVIGDGRARVQVETAFEAIDPTRVTFLGLRPQAEIAALLGACDLFLWPAVAEPLGMAMLEAHAAGLPVVAGDSGGVSDIVRHGETGLLAPPGDAKAFAASVEALLMDSDLRRAMGARARARAEAAHSLEVAAGTLHHWLAPLIQSGRR
ncbi:MAG TPA: glycosyltransferase family 4 protein [Gammaproteobacteria bacterium]|nr:glycosyltransferase family 4 protein [Gammaproteobacteria bacterium]